MKEIITAIFFGILINLLSESTPGLMSFVLVGVGIISAFFSFKIGVSFGRKITFGRAFTFLGLSFVTWSISIALAQVTAQQIVLFLKLVGYFFAVLCIYNLGRGLRKVRGVRKGIEMTWLISILLLIPIIVGVYSGIPIYFTFLQLGTVFVLSWIYYIVRTRETREFNHGILLLLVASALLSMYYLLYPVTPTELLYLPQIAYTVAWILALWALVRTTQDLGFGKFYM